MCPEKEGWLVMPFLYACVNLPTALSLVTLTGRSLAPYTAYVTPCDVLFSHTRAGVGGIHPTCTEHVICLVRAVSLTTAFPRRRVAEIQHNLLFTG